MKQLLLSAVLLSQLQVFHFLNMNKWVLTKGGQFFEKSIDPQHISPDCHRLLKTDICKENL